MLRTPIILAIFLIACSPLPAVTPSDQLLESMKKAFVQHITAGKSDFKVSGVADKEDDKRLFYKNPYPVFMCREKRRSVIKRSLYDWANSLAIST